jgi:polyisoprenoid-binding protein YceI
MKKILAVIAVIVLVAVGVVAYSFLRTPEEASGPIESIPITAEVEESSEAEVAVVAAEATATAPEEETPAQPETETDAAAEPAAQTEAETSTDPNATPNADQEATTVTEMEEEASSQASEPGSESGGSSITFEIIPAGSEARFIIDEVLRGAPKTVVGATDQVAGQLALDPNDLSNAQVGVVRVNARTLATDNDFRNRAIKNQILRTNDFEFVTFTPTQVVGLPETGTVGETYTFQVVGDLTITNVTKQVTFDVEAVATSETQIEGIATTAFPYTDFELFIPDAPAVDTVDDEVRLELEFVAEAVQ